VGHDQRIRDDGPVHAAGDRQPELTHIATVFVVDDEVSVCIALSRLIRAAGFHVETFGSATELFNYGRLQAVDCLVLDVHLPDLNGLDLQAKLADKGLSVPIVFITARGDIPMSVRAMKAGALEFLTKPFDDQMLLNAIGKAVDRQRSVRQREREAAVLNRRYESLTPRERAVMALVVRGLLNKQIAAELEIAEKTVKIHRGHVMRKMGADSVPHLVRMADAVGIGSTGSGAF
jgi:FixJ family two-component response regulator